MKPTIAIIVEGGMVQNILSDTPITTVVIDHDTEGTPDNELSRVDGVDTGIILSHFTPELNPQFVKQFAENEQEPSLVHEGDNDYLMPEGMNSCWITVGQFSVYLVRHPDGSAESLVYPRGKEDDVAVASAYAFAGDLEVAA